MPSSSALYVERLVSGQRSQEFETDVPVGYEVVFVKGDDHVHVVYGTPEELKEAGLKVTRAPRKPAAKKAPAKAPAKRKSAAKKPAAKKSTAKKSTARKRK